MCLEFCASPAECLKPRGFAMHPSSAPQSRSTILRAESERQIHFLTTHGPLMLKSQRTQHLVCSRTGEPGLVCTHASKQTLLTFTLSVSFSLESSLPLTEHPV